MESISVTDIMQKSLPANHVQGAVDDYNSFYEGQAGETRRKREYTTLVNHYYDLATDFFEFGWGPSFHFAPRYKGESFEASIARHEHYMSAKLGLKPGMKVADVGCGIGGPMRAIARFSGASIVGVNNNAYQIKRAIELCRKQHLAHLCSFEKCDYYHMPFADNTFDAVYALESTCHAPDKPGIYAEMFRVLKPGALLTSYEWCMTPTYDPKNPVHVDIKRLIEEGDGLPDIATIPTVMAGLKSAGFEILETQDLAETSDPETPWYLPLDDKWYSKNSYKSTRGGRWATRQLVRGLEALRIAPKGSTATSDFLEKGALALVDAGRVGIFTPMYYVLVRKPLR